jgi:hypothetical protein
MAANTGTAGLSRLVKYGQLEWMCGPGSSSRGLLLEREEQSTGTVDQEEGKNEYANMMTGDASSIAIESILTLDQLRN